jgi:hypothetical protein
MTLGLPGSPRISLTVKPGLYAGEELSFGHIIARTVVRELHNVIANLEFLPLRLNQSNNDKNWQQRSLPVKLHELKGSSGEELGSRSAFRSVLLWRVQSGDLHSQRLGEDFEFRIGHTT